MFIIIVNNLTHHEQILYIYIIYDKQKTGLPHYTSVSSQIVGTITLNDIPHFDGGVSTASGQ